MNLERIGLWPARLTWFVAPLTIGPGLVRALEARPSTPALLVEIAIWAAWFAVLVASLTPSPSSLTVTRCAGPAAVGAILLAGLAEGWDGSILLGSGFGSLFTAFCFLPTFGDRMINGSAYGSERRMALRPPAFVLLGPAQLAWSLVFAGLVAAPLLVLSERFVPAIAAAVAGAVAVWAGGRVLDQLARRWIVFVPAGFVIRDPMMLVDSVLLRRNEVVALGPATVDNQGRGAPAGPLDDDPFVDDPAGGDDPASGDDPAGGDSAAGRPTDGRIDLSGGALGLAIEVALVGPTPITVRQRGRLRNQQVSNIVFSPTLPGAMLTEARIRGMKIGDASVGT